MKGRRAFYRITEKVTAAHKITVSSTRTGTEKCWKTNRADLEYSVGSRVTGRKKKRRKSMTSLHCVHLAVKEAGQLGVEEF